MLEIRKVRVGDVTLQSNQYRAPNDGTPTEYVRLKAASIHRSDDADRAGDALDWASVHMNLGVANAQPPGKQLMLALADEPRNNEFGGTLDGKAMKGYVNIPKDDDFFSFVIAPRDWLTEGGDDPADEGYVIEFQGNHAADFVRALLRWWYRDGFGKEAQPSGGVADVLAVSGDTISRTCKDCDGTGWITVRQGVCDWDQEPCHCMTDMGR